MKLVLSPAKSLDFKTEVPTNTYAVPAFIDEAEKINAKLEKKSKKALKELMGLSDALVQLNYERYKEFSRPFTIENARQAVYAFSGDVYVGLDAYSIPNEKIKVLEDKVRILSGMYGILKPLDLIQPYRLEMGTALPILRKKNLYEFWQKKLTQFLNEELEENELFVNLASKEYFKAIDAKNINADVVSPVFKDFKNGELKIISFFAKKARGSMARYCVDKNLENKEQLLQFDYDGYAYSEAHTTNPLEPVFIR